MEKCYFCHPLLHHCTLNSLIYLCHTHSPPNTRPTQIHRERDWVLTSWLSWLLLVLGNCIDCSKVVFNGNFVGYLSWYRGSNFCLLNYYVWLLSVRSCQFPLPQSRRRLSSHHFQLSDRAVAHNCFVASHERSIGQVRSPNTPAVLPYQDTSQHTLTTHPLSQYTFSIHSQDMGRVSWSGGM